MQYFRRNRYFTLCARLLAAAVFLRAFIAPGFMLSVSPEDGFGIVFCNGPVAAFAPDDHPAGDLAEHHHHGDDGKSGPQGHVPPTCGHWSVSSLFVTTALYTPPLAVPSAATLKPVPRPAPFQTFPAGPRVTRGPPASV